jgi:hypothetical protein
MGVVRILISCSEERLQKTSKVGLNVEMICKKPTTNMGTVFKMDSRFISQRLMTVTVNIRLIIK